MGCLCPFCCTAQRKRTCCYCFLTYVCPFGVCGGGDELYGCTEARRLFMFQITSDFSFILHMRMYRSSFDRIDADIQEALIKLKHKKTGFIFCKPHSHTAHRCNIIWDKWWTLFMLFLIDVGAINQFRNPMGDTYHWNILTWKIQMSIYMCCMCVKNFRKMYQLRIMRICEEQGFIVFSKSLWTVYRNITDFTIMSV